MRVSKRFIVLVLIILTPLWLWLAWIAKTPRELNAFILDKTVLTNAADEHRSFTWVLHNEKFVKADGELYDNAKDYYGFFPRENHMFDIRDIKGFDGHAIDSLSHELDMLYFTDTYGIYTDDWFRTDRGTLVDEKTMKLFKRLYLKKAATERSRELYGGLQEEELALMVKMKQKNKLILSEFNLMASPTAGHIRREVEEEFDFRWTGWTGRFFDNLDTATTTELPKWVVQLYKEQHHGKWPFTRSGLVFVHENETIAILENGFHLHDDVPVIRTSKAVRDRFDLPAEVVYPFWFDVIKSGSSNTVLSNFHIGSNIKGDSILNRFGIPKSFPAAIEKTDNQRFYYFAADFSDSPIRINYLSHMRGLGYFSRLMYSHADRSDRNRFFWKYYRPLITKIVNDYHAETMEKGS